MTNLKIIDNFLSADKFDELQRAVMSKDFPWFFNDSLVNEVEENLGNYQFIHYFVKNGLPSSNFYSLLYSVASSANMACIYRAKANLNTYRGTPPVKSSYHVDEDFTNCFKTGILYLNTNNGYTEIETGGKIESKANRFCSFDLSVRHRAVYQTNSKHRVVINFVYVEKDFNG